MKKLLASLANPQAPPKGMNELTIDEILSFMKDQFNPKRFIVRKRFNFGKETRGRKGAIWKGNQGNSYKNLQLEFVQTWQLVISLY